MASDSMLLAGMSACDCQLIIYHLTVSKLPDVVIKTAKLLPALQETSWHCSPPMRPSVDFVLFLHLTAAVQSF